MVLYSTFLTRSGVLGETSVHSFVDAGMWAYWLLLGFIVVFTAIGFGLLFARMKEMPKVPVEHALLSREFALFLGAASLTFIAVFVTIGTSSPIITGILKGKASAVDISYYVKTNLPLGIALTFLSGLGQLLWWKTSQSTPFLKRLIAPAILGAAITTLVLALGTEEWQILLFVFCSGFSLFANLQVGAEIYRGNPKFAGGAIAHIGIAVMCLGFVTSERYDQKKTMALEKNKPAEAMGYQLRYVGYRPNAEGKYGFEVEVERDGRKRIVAPVMYFSEFTKSVMRHPDLINYIDRDFYVAPLSLEEAQVGARELQQELVKEQPTQVSGVTVTFADFDMGNFEKGAMIEGKEFAIKAHLNVTDGKKSAKLTLTMKGGGGEMPKYIGQDFVDTKGERYAFNLIRIEPNREDKSKSKVQISVTPPNLPESKPKDETLVIEASVKPYINLVWVGTVTLVVGFFLTIVRRVEEARLKE
jgi:cytochrome c-type biogenesis protein CcmF